MQISVELMDSFHTSQSLISEKINIPDALRIYGRQSQLGLGLGEVSQRKPRFELKYEIVFN